MVRSSIPNDPFSFPPFSSFFLYPLFTCEKGLDVMVGEGGREGEGEGSSLLSEREPPKPVVEKGELEFRTSKVVPF